MADPLNPPVIAMDPLSVVLMAQAFSTETQEALREWDHYLRTLQRPYEILLIQEFRPEAPPSDVADGQDRVQPARALSYDRAFGIRDALNEAIRSAQHPLLVFCTCDTQFGPAELEKMLKVLEHAEQDRKSADMVVGYRVCHAVPFWRLALDTVAILLSRVILGVPLAPTACWLGREGRGRRWIARWVFGVRVTDPECPFRLVRRAVFARMPIQSRGNSFALVEMLAKANHLGCLIAEEPVTWTPSALPASDAIPFSDDAWRVFRDAEFTPALPVIPTLPPTEPGEAQI